jgi:Mn2+/Fe2+ NRAMP family transporter
MADVAERSGQIAPELPTKNLPGVEYRDLPEPASLRRYMGASVILAATAMGSGELIIWPFITTQVGIGILWFMAIGFTAQYFLNMEIERYTLATGETAVTGFTRFWMPWGIFFILGAILPNAWPGWATSGATVLTFIFEWGEGAKIPIAIIFLVAIGLALTLSPVIYQTLEKVQMVLIGIILLFVLVALFVATTGSAWTSVVTEVPEGVGNFWQSAQVIGAATLLGAIAFAGAGGANNLVQSNYVRDKQMGMGARIPQIVSPVTGEEEAAPSLGYMFETNEQNMRRWRAWWRIANQEQLITFLGLGLLITIVLSVLAYSTVGVQDLGRDLDFIRAEGDVLKEVIAPWFGTFFYIAGFVVLFSTNIGVIDYVSRLTADSLKVTFLRESTFWSESKIYVTVAWLIIVAGSIVMLTVSSQPLVLLIIASAGGGVVMFFYSGMLIWLNRRALPEPIKLKSWRFVIMWLIFIFFGALSGFLLYSFLAG